MDTAFLYAETPTMHFHVVGVLVLDPSSAPGGWHSERLEEMIAKRLHIIAPFRWRLVNVPGGIDRPRWIEDPDFDIRHHVRRATLPPPGGRDELAQFTSEVASHQLDRCRPLWEMWVVDGLVDGTIALVSKVHHAIMDGAGGGNLMASMFDLTPEGSPVAEPGAMWWPEQTPAPAALVSQAFGHAVTRTLSLPALAYRTVRGLGGVVRMLSEQRANGGGAGLLAPWTPLNGPLTSARRVALARCSFDDVRRAKKAFGTTVNDVVLAATASAMRGYLLKRDALPGVPLLASVPVSVRAAGQEFGNHTSTLIVALPTQLEDPLERLHVIHGQATAAKAAQRAMGAEMIEDVLAVTPPSLMSAAARMFCGLRLTRFLPPVINLIVSNVAGPPIPLYCAGARLLATYPMGPLIEGTGLNLTVLSQNGDLDVGVMTCPDLVDDAEAITAGFADGLEELATAARPKIRKRA